MATNLFLNSKVDVQYLIDIIKDYDKVVNLNVFIVGIDEATTILKPQIVEAVTALVPKKIEPKPSKNYSAIKAYAALGCKKLGIYDWYAVASDGKIGAVLIWDGDKDDHSSNLGPDPKKWAKRYLNAMIEGGVGRELSIVRAKKATDKKGNTFMADIMPSNDKIRIKSIDVANGIVEFEKVQTTVNDKSTKRVELITKRDENIHKAIGQDFTATRQNISATFTVTENGKFLGKDGITYDSPSSAIGECWKKGGVTINCSVNGWITPKNKNGLCLDQILGI